MLRSSATLLTGGAVGAVTAGSIATESASAADAALSVSGDEVEIRGETVSAVPLDLTVQWEYEVPSGEDPATLVVETRAGPSESELEAVATRESAQAFLANSGEEGFEVDMLAEGVLDRDAITPSERGAETATEVAVGVELRLLDESGMVIAADSATDTATVTIAKDDYDPNAHGDVSGEGSVTIVVE